MTGSERIEAPQKGVQLSNSSRGLLETDPQAWLRAHVPMLSHPDARQTATGLALRRCLAWAAPWGARV